MKQVWSDASPRHRHPLLITPFPGPPCHPLPPPFAIHSLYQYQKTKIRVFACLEKKRVTDGPMDGWINGRTDRPSYRDARTHLKSDG